MLLVLDLIQAIINLMFVHPLRAFCSGGSAFVPSYCLSMDFSLLIMKVDVLR